MTEPDQILRSFVFGLPEGIRQTILSQCCLAFGRYVTKNNFDFEDAFEQILNSSDGAWRAFQVAKVVGVIEVLLNHDGDHRHLFEKLAAEDPQAEVFTRKVLQAPLCERQLAEARSSFNELRRGLLSPEWLRRWWNYLQLNDFVRQPVAA